MRDSVDSCTDTRQFRVEQQSHISISGAGDMEGNQGEQDELLKHRYISLPVIEKRDGQVCEIVRYLNMQPTAPPKMTPPSPNAMQ